MFLRLVEPPGLRAGPLAHPWSAQTETEKRGANACDLKNRAGRTPQQVELDRLGGEWGIAFLGRAPGRNGNSRRVSGVLRASRGGGVRPARFYEPQRFNPN